MRMRDAWRPIDEVAGTAIDTFSYCVERGDGAFYPTKVGMVFGSDSQPFTNPISWHSWHAMQSLMDEDSTRCRSSSTGRTRRAWSSGPICDSAATAAWTRT